MAAQNFRTISAHRPSLPDHSTTQWEFRHEIPDGAVHPLLAIFLFGTLGSRVAGLPARWFFGALRFGDLFRRMGVRFGGAVAVAQSIAAFFLGIDDGRDAAAGRVGDQLPPQYVSVDSAMTHGFLFAVYALALYVIVRWHERPSLPTAFFLGLVIGLSCITRPTEGVMLFLALLWMFEKQSKWSFFKQNPAYLGWAVAGGFLAILPQLLYWKAVTGNWIFDVGAKFLFFRPHWQVLFGWEKGWFIYTPVTVLMVAGLFFMRPYPFRKAVLSFAILNIWIVIAWSDWRYGASYSCRALVQSYPVMALPLAIIVQKMLQGRLKFAAWAGFGFLIYLNLFQIWQYNSGILHYNDMNRRYYQAIFLNPRPSPLDMSLLDTEEMIRNESDFREKNIFRSDSTFLINKAKQSKVTAFEAPLRQLAGYESGKEQWLRVTAQVNSAWGAFDTWLVAEVVLSERRKRTACRMENGICVKQNWNTIEFYFRLPEEFAEGNLTIGAETNSVQDIYIKGVTISLLEK